MLRQESYHAKKHESRNAGSSKKFLIIAHEQLELGSLGIGVVNLPRQL